MEVIVPEDSADIARIAADRICALLDRKPNAVLGLATGSTPVPLYTELIRRYEAGEVSFAQASAFILDEYVGLPEGHPQAYVNVIRSDFTAHVDFADGAVHAPDGRAEDIPASCAEYEEKIVAAGGVDLQILGIGTDGHIAFNEPGSSLSSRTRVKALMPQTRVDNARFFDNDLSQVPYYSITQGLGTVMEARRVMLLATGVGKSEAILNLVEGPISARWPATILQYHQHATVFADESAASRLINVDYYRQAFANRPSWQE